MNILVGIRYSQGAFTPEGSTQERNYDNVILHILSDGDGDVNGLGCNPVKIKRDVAIRAFGTENIAQYLYCEIELQYALKNALPILHRVLVTSKPQPIAVGGVAVSK